MLHDTPCHLVIIWYIILYGLFYCRFWPPTTGRWHIMNDKWIKCVFVLLVRPLSWVPGFSVTAPWAFNWFLDGNANKVNISIVGTNGKFFLINAHGVLRRMGAVTEIPGSNVFVNGARMSGVCAFIAGYFEYEHKTLLIHRPATLFSSTRYLQVKRHKLNPLCHSTNNNGSMLVIVP